MNGRLTSGRSALTAGVAFTARALSLADSATAGSASFSPFPASPGHCFALWANCGQTVVKQWSSCGPWLAPSALPFPPQGQGPTGSGPESGPASTSGPVSGAARAQSVDQHDYLTSIYPVFDKVLTSTWPVYGQGAGPEAARLGVFDRRSTFLTSPWPVFADRDGSARSTWTGPQRASVGSPTTGQILVKYWLNTGQILVKYWFMW
jgi:hypothetical protein